KEFFAKCGTREVAKSASNTTASAGENAILVDHYSFNGTSNEGGLNNVTFNMSVTVPAFAPAIASAFNVLNWSDKVTSFKLRVVGADGSGSRNKVIKNYEGKDGVLVSVNLDEENKADGSLTLHLSFEYMAFDNEVTNTSGIITTLDGGH
ncbi:hypothetical protein IBE39_09735, partial [Francisella philomiragia]